MKCQSRQAQLFITAGLCFVTASLFLKLTVWVETENPEMSKQNANIFVSETPVTPTVPSSFPTPILSPDDKTQKPNYHTVPATALPDEQPALSVPYYYVAQQYLKDNISYLYVTGILLLMIYLILQLGSLEFIRRKSRFKEQRGCIKVYHTPYSTPFSYSYNIFLPTNIEPEKQKFVLAHEESHIWHRHFYKLLFLQCVASVNWFNPFVWLLIRSIKELQEMEADKDVLDNGYDREQYQINLVLTCTENKEWILAKSNYNYSSLKSRILFMNKYFIGIDIGSTCAKTVVMNHEKEILHRFLQPTGWSSVDTANQIQELLREKGILPEESVVVATGYGRVSVPYAAKCVTEITCHAKGACYIHKNENMLLIDIGGQDTKIIRIENDMVTDFLMNDKCSAGTGRFLEVMANTLSLTPQDLCELASKGSGTSISSMCTVFAESEVISLIGRGESRENIAFAVIDSIVQKVVSQAARLTNGQEECICLTGGLCDYSYLKKSLGESLKTDVLTDTDGRYAGAIGAALSATTI